MRDWSELSGLEQLQALIDLGKPPPMMALLDVRLTEISPGHAVFEAEPGEQVYNPQGTVHGGYAATLLDSACGCAVQSQLKPGQGYTTLELKIAYHRPMTKDTGVVRAVGSLLSFGRRAAFAEARLEGEGGRLFASATSTLMVFDGAR